MSISDRDKKILLLIVPLALIAAYWFLLLSPKREEASTASAALTEQQERLESARAAAQSADDAEQGFEATYASVVRLGKAIPSTVDMPSLLVQLDAAAAGTGIRFNTITAGPRTAATPAAPAAEGSGSGAEGAPAAAGGETAQSAPGSAVENANNAQQTSNAQSSQAEQATGVDTQTSTSAREGGLPVGGGAAQPGASTTAGAVPAGLETVPLELEFVGNFFKLADFFHGLKRFVRVANEDVLVSGRLLTIEHVRWASDSEIFPNIRASVSATVYLSPLSQGVTAGATPQGPAPTTPAGTQTTPAGSAPAPAATPTATATP